MGRKQRQESKIQEPQMCKPGIPKPLRLLMSPCVFSSKMMLWAPVPHTLGFPQPTHSRLSPLLASPLPLLFLAVSSSKMDPPLPSFPSGKKTGIWSHPDLSLNPHSTILRRLNFENFVSLLEAFVFSPWKMLRRWLWR